MARITLESVINTIDITNKTIKSIKTVCKNNESVTQYISNPVLKRNIKENAERMFTFIEVCEQKIDDTVDDVKSKFNKLSNDILGINQTYQSILDDLNQWLEIPNLQEQQINSQLNDLAKEFPNQSGNFDNIYDKINLYINAIQRKIEKLINKLYEQIQEYIEILISKLKTWIDPYLKKLKEFGDKLLQYAKEWIGNALDWVKDSTLGQYAVTGFELAKGILEQFPEVDIEKFVDGIDLDFSNLQSSLDNSIQSVGNILGDMVSNIGANISGLINDPSKILSGSSGSNQQQPPNSQDSQNNQQQQQNDNKFPQKIQDQDPQTNNEGTFKEGIFTEQDDPNQAKFNAPDGMGIKNNDLGGGTLFTVPTTSFNPQYTKNFPNVTPGGHITELDDTPGSERSFQYHPAGTSTEVQPDGQKVNRIKGDKFEVIEKNGNIQINGVCNIQISGDARITVGGDAYNVISGNSAQIVKGNINQTVFGNSEQEIKGNVFQYTQGNVKQQINGSVIQEIKGDLNQKVNGNIWQQILGNSQQHIKGNVQQITQGSVKQIIDGNVEMNVKGNMNSFIDGSSKILIKGELNQAVEGNVVQKINGSLVQGIKGTATIGVDGSLNAKVQGDATLNLNSNVNAKIGGNLDFKVGGSFNVKQASTTLTSSGETTIKGSRISLN